MNTDPLQDIHLSISAVERDTGLSKDTLRMWERRYGFPSPTRDNNGERAYSLTQVEKLRLIVRLLALGHRPGKVIGLPTAALEAMGSRTAAATSSTPGSGPGETEPAEIAGFLELIRSHQLAGLRQRLLHKLATEGLSRFVCATVAPLNVAVGEAWIRGQLKVFEEHLYTEQIQSVLRTAISALPSPWQPPRVLLTSLPDEPHNLGLLMVEALLAVEGATCIPLGTETPCDEIARAARAHQIDVVALSFSASFGPRQAWAGLTQLRGLLPEPTALWAGGATMAQLRKPPPGIDRVVAFTDLLWMLGQWRQTRSTEPC